MNIIESSSDRVDPTEGDHPGFGLSCRVCGVMFRSEAHLQTHSHVPTAVDSAVDLCLIDFLKDACGEDKKATAEVDEHPGQPAVSCTSHGRLCVSDTDPQLHDYSSGNPPDPTCPTSTGDRTHDGDKTSGGESQGTTNLSTRCSVCLSYFFSECCREKHLHLFHSAPTAEQWSNPIRSVSHNPPQSCLNSLSDCRTNKQVKPVPFDQSLSDCDRNLSDGEMSSSSECHHVVVYDPLTSSDPQLGYVCGHCGRDFKLKRSLFRHLKKYDQDSTQAVGFVCETCKKVFSRVDNYKRHVETHTKPLTCWCCDRSFWSDDKYRSHLQAHVVQPQYKCPQCDRTFNRKNNLTMHMTTHSDNRPFHCEDCPQKFKLKDALLKHVSIVHQGIRNYPCQHCDNRFINSTLLNRHVNKVHQHQPPAHACQICGRKFHEASSLKRHSFSQHPDQLSLPKRQQIICELCGKSFAFKALFNQHMTVHYEGLPYPCDHPGCVKRYRSSSSLLNHKKKHGNVTDLFKCDQCGQQFTQKGSLKRHLIIHTGIRKFRCKYPNCSVAFNQSTSLHRHMRVHTGDTPYVCQCCGQRFNQSGGVTKHLTTRAHARCRTYIEQQLGITVLEASKLPPTAPQTTGQQWTNVDQTQTLTNTAEVGADDVDIDDIREECITTSGLMIQTDSSIITFEDDINSYVDGL